MFFRNLKLQSINQDTIIFNVIPQRSLNFFPPVQALSTPQKLSLIWDILTTNKTNISIPVKKKLISSEIMIFFSQGVGVGCNFTWNLSF